MMTSVLIAGLAGGLAMYLWSAVAHIALPLGEIGVSQMTADESSVLGPMQASLGQHAGLYVFPSMGSGPRAEAMKAYDAKLVSNPSGLLIYNPPGGKAMEPGQLITEFLTEMLEALIAIWLLAQTRISSFAGRVAFVSVAGLLAAMPTNLAYWNWYHFPVSYTVSYMFMEIVGFVCAGVVAAFVLRKEKLQA